MPTLTSWAAATLLALAALLGRDALAQDAPVSHFQEVWSSRAGNYWLYVLNTQTGSVAACDWLDDKTDVGRPNCRAPTAAVSTVDANRHYSLIVPTSSDNNSIALADDSGRVSLCYLKKDGTADKLVCTPPTDAFPGATQ
jgi:hypothetical protein